MCIYFSYWRLHWCFLDVIEVQRLEIQSIFGRYGSQHLDDTVTFKCWWNIGRLSVVYNTMRFRVFLKASSILETSSTGDQKCYRPYDTTTSTSIKTSLNNRLHILLNICAIILICHVTLIKKKKRNFVWSWREVTAPNFGQWHTTINTKKHLRSRGQNRDICAAPLQAFLT